MTLKSFIYGSDEQNKIHAYKHIFSEGVVEQHAAKSDLESHPGQ